MWTVPRNINSTSFCVCWLLGKTDKGGIWLLVPKRCHFSREDRSFREKDEGQHKLARSQCQMLDTQRPPLPIEKRSVK